MVVTEADKLTLGQELTIRVPYSVWSIREIIG
jgi:hypothetical protein